MTDIFLSYRSADSAFAVAEIWKPLAERFGRDHVFRADDSISSARSTPPRSGGARRGRRGGRRDRAAVVRLGRERCPPHRRPHRLVRYELRTAYERKIPVIPVLPGETPMPAPELVPADIALLARSQFWRIGHRQTDSNITGLVQRLLRETGPPRPTTTGGTDRQYEQLRGPRQQYRHQPLRQPDRDDPGRPLMSHPTVRGIPIGNSPVQRSTPFCRPGGSRIVSRPTPLAEPAMSSRTTVAIRPSARRAGAQTADGPGSPCPSC